MNFTLYRDAKWIYMCTNHLYYFKLIILSSFFKEKSKTNLFLFRRLQCEIKEYDSLLRRERRASLERSPSETLKQYEIDGYWSDKATPPEVEGSASNQDGKVRFLFLHIGC